MKVTELREGQFFKFNSRQRNWRVFSKVHEIGKLYIGPKEHKGKLLVFYNGCSQAIVSKDASVIV